MAKIVGFINAVLSGKLGGTVYANNKSGSYVRQYVIPTNPSTDAQVAARGSFTSALSAWHSLTDSDKSAWNSYATTNFASKSGGIGTYSGFNAFTSLRNAAINAARNSRATDWLGGASALTTTSVNYVAPLTAPGNSFTNNIKLSTGTAVPLTLTGATFGTDSIASITMSIPSTVVSAPIFQDAIGDIPTGYALYAGNAMSQPNQFVANPFMECIGVMKPPVISSGWTSASTITGTFSTVADFNIPARKMWYVVGDTVRITVFAIGSNGAMKMIGSKTVVAT